MGTVEGLLSIAKAQIGVKENPPDSNNVLYNTWYYGREVRDTASTKYPWCMAWCMWCCYKAEVPLPIKTASCSALMNAAKNAGMWFTSGYQPGDITIYDFSGKRSTASHCGIVEEIIPDYGVRAIEGNTSISGSQSNGGMVCRKDRHSKFIIGVVRPKFDTVSKEEDEDMTQEKFNQMFETAMYEYRKSLQDNDSSDYSKEAREYAIKTGLFSGGNPLPDGQPNFMWEDLLTREQCATLFYRFAQKNGLV